MSRHQRASKWTQIYWSSDPSVTTGPKLRPYVRIVPDMVDTSKTVFPHGLSVGGFHETVEAANAFADHLDTFLDILEQSIKEDNG